MALLKEKKVVLFGRTGDGKSTVANALVTGGIKDVVFSSSDAARGHTSEIKKASGRGWTVTDTVGLGEADKGTVSNTSAKEMLTTFLKTVKDDYSHIIFVQKANRLTLIDEMNWLLFTQIFDGAEEAFVILFTSADQKWLEKNRDKLPKYMDGVEILAVDIPPISSRTITERRQRDIRARSIQNLDEDLVKIFQKRGNKFSTPRIAQMNDEELEQKSSSLMQFIVDTIKRMFNSAMWLTIASKLGTLVSVANLALQLAAAVSL
ncbi:unnamed protein product [Calypogeia fissa]